MSLLTAWIAVERAPTASEIERAERMRIAQIGRNTAELPLIAAGIDLGALYELSALLKAQGL